MIRHGVSLKVGVWPDEAADGGITCLRAASILRDSVPFTRNPPLVRPYVRRGHASRVLREGKRGSTFKREREKEREKERGIRTTLEIR